MLVASVAASIWEGVVGTGLGRTLPAVDCLGCALNGRAVEERRDSGVAVVVGWTWWAANGTRQCGYMGTVELRSLLPPTTPVLNFSVPTLTQWPCGYHGRPIT